MEQYSQHVTERSATAVKLDSFIIGEIELRHRFYNAHRILYANGWICYADTLLENVYPYMVQSLKENVSIATYVAVRKWICQVEKFAQAVYRGLT